MKRKYNSGDIVKGKVTKHANFGFFVEIEDEPCFLGLVEIVHVASNDTGRVITKLDFPNIGSVWNFEVINYRDDNNQVYLKWDSQKMTHCVQE